MQISRFYINGSWRESALSRPVRNPYSGDETGRVWQASGSDIADAISGAAEAFAQTRSLTSHERWEILSAISDGVKKEKERLARLITTETGKPISSSRVEVERAIFTFLTAAEEAKRLNGDVLPLDLSPQSGQRMGIVRRFPLGPVAGITPFNFPLNLVAHKVGPAIAAGNSIVLKPSSSAPLIAIALAEIVQRTALPRGGFSVVPCLANEANQLITDERIKLVSFTGSPAVGWPIKERAGRKRVVLELGGNAGVIIDADADLGYALPRIVSASFGNAGQSCIAVQRVFVHQSLFSRFLEEFVPLSKAVPVGDPVDEKTMVGPMITEGAAKRVESWIDEARGAGARVLCGGGRRGAMLDPTVIVDVTPEMNVCAEEVFAPVVTVEPFAEFAEAIARVNNSRFGLQAGVFTNTLSHVMTAYRGLEVGGVMVNDVPTYRIDHMPYGGVKESGFGREGVKYAIEEMTELKLLGINMIP
jgi:acyl-CoA reductase-like NAD-dependent aldehyde dehydrogenase